MLHGLIARRKTARRNIAIFHSLLAMKTAHLFGAKPNALIDVTTSAEMHGAHHLRNTRAPRMRCPGPGTLAETVLPLPKLHPLPCLGPNCLPHTPALGPAAGCGEHCDLLITDLRAKLIFSPDRDVPLKNDFNVLPKAARLPRAVSQTPTTSAASRTSHKVDTSELDWLTLLMSCPLRPKRLLSSALIGYF